MIVWHDRLFMDSVVKQEPENYMRDVEEGKWKCSLYCVTLPSNGDNLLDIYHVNEFRFPHYRRKTLVVVGLAVSRDSACELVREIVESVYRETQDVDVGKYFGQEEGHGKGRREE